MATAVCKCPSAFPALWPAHTFVPSGSRPPIFSNALSLLHSSCFFLRCLSIYFLCYHCCPFLLIGVCVCLCVCPIEKPTNV